MIVGGCRTARVGRLARWWLAAWLILTSGVGQALAQEAADHSAENESTEGHRARARRHFNMGVEFFRESNFGAALIEFRRAYALVPHYKVLFNLGQTYIELQEYGQAVVSLQGYLDGGGAEIPPEQRRKVLAMIERQQGRLATLTVHCEQTGARVFVDNRLQGTTPLADALQVGAGRRMVRVEKEGFVTREERVELGAGDEHELHFDLESTAVAKPEIERSSSPPRDLPTYPSVANVDRDDTWLWVSGVTTVVFGGATVALAVLTQSAEDDLASERNTLTTESDLKKLQDKLHRRALYTDLALGATVVAGAATAVLFFVLNAESESDIPSLSLDVRRDGGKLSWQAHF